MALVSFSDKVSTLQAVTATAVSTDAIDLRVARDMGMGENLVANVALASNATTDGNATVSVDVIVADNIALTTNVTVLASSRSYTYVELRQAAGVGAPAGLPIAIAVPPIMQGVGRRYLGVRYNVTVGTGTLTGSTWNAYFAPSTRGEARKFYTSGYTV